MVGVNVAAKRGREVEDSGRSVTVNMGFTAQTSGFGRVSVSPPVPYNETSDDGKLFRGQDTVVALECQGLQVRY